MYSASFDSNALMLWGLADSEGHVPQRWPIRRDSKKDPHAGEASICIPTHPGSTSQPPPLLWGSLPRGHYLSVLLPESPQGQVPNYGQPLCPRACCNDPVQPTLSLLTLPHLRLPAETPKEASAHRWGFFVWPWVAPPLRNCNKISFQWQLSPDLLALPYLNNTKTYILKQCPGLEVSGGSPGGSKARMRPTGRGSKLRWGDGVTA